MRRVLLAVLGLAATAMLAGAPTAGAQAPTSDSVVGDQGGFDQSRFHIDASSDPAGENPVGTVNVGVAPSFVLQVTCLSVTGNEAIIGFTGTVSFMSIRIPIAGLIRAVDGGDSASTPDSFDWAYANGVPPTPVPGPDSCSSFPGPFPPAFEQVEVTTGEITVVDAKPPPKPRFFKFSDCRLGGWARIGFKSRRQCDNFVRWQCRDGRHAYYGFPTVVHCRLAIRS